MNREHDRSLKNAIQRMAGTFNKQYLTLTSGNIVSVDNTTRQCVVLLDNDVEVSCKLMAAVGDGLYLIPSVDSTVAVIYGTYEDAYIIMCSDVDSISFKGSELGGLVKVIDLVSQLNTIQNGINDLKNIFSSWTPVPNDGGAVLKTLLSTWQNKLLNLTQRSDIENTSVSHGS